MSNLKEITFVFENCETISYNADSIRYFQIHGITEKFANFSNAIFKMLCIDGLEIILKPNPVPSETGFWTEMKNPNERLMNDITSISIEYEDESVEDYYLKWPEDDESQGQWHSGQKFVTSEKGFIQIVSKCKEDFETYTLEELDSLY